MPHSLLSLKQLDQTRLLQSLGLPDDPARTARSRIVDGRAEPAPILATLQSLFHLRIVLIALLIALVIGHGQREAAVRLIWKAKMDGTWPVA